jgi:hypothetical protein
MSQILNAGPGALREALYTLSNAQDIPDAKLLDDVVRRYPQFGDELTEMAIAIAVDALRGTCMVEAAEAATDPRVVSAAVSRAMSHFQNRLHAVSTNTSSGPVEGAPPTGVDAPNPFLGLQRNEFRALAGRINANTVFVAKLRDRQIDPHTMTRGFQKRVADELKASFDLVVAHFAGGEGATARQFFKAESKPSSGGQQTFEQAVRSSGLSEAQQRLLLEM